MFVRGRSTCPGDSTVFLGGDAGVGLHLVMGGTAPCWTDGLAGLLHCRRTVYVSDGWVIYAGAPEGYVLGGLLL